MRREKGNSDNLVCITKIKQTFLYDQLSTENRSSNLTQGLVGHVVQRKTKVFELLFAVPHGPIDFASINIVCYALVSKQKRFLLHTSNTQTLQDGELKNKIIYITPGCLPSQARNINTPPCSLGSAHQTHSRGFPLTYQQRCSGILHLFQFQLWDLSAPTDVSYYIMKKMMFLHTTPYPRIFELVFKFGRVQKATQVVLFAPPKATPLTILYQGHGYISLVPHCKCSYIVALLLAQLS